MIHVLYHGNCYDGFGAAYAAWLKLGDLDVSYRSCTYDEGVKPLEEIPDGSEVYVLDFSFERQALIENTARFKKLMVLDHHVTAQKNLEGLENCIFDLKRSGAMLAWNYFHPGKEPPALLSHIQDRDLWKFEILGTQYVHLALLAEPFDFKVWDKLDVPTLIISGRSMAKLQAQQIENICSKAMMLHIGPELIPAANTSVYFSEVPSRLLELYPDAKYSAYFYEYSKGESIVRQWGLRSRPDYDVSVVARMYGGGGHAQAAGFVQEINYKTLDLISGLENFVSKGCYNVFEKTN